MRLSEFILRNREQILEEWEAFARTLLPASQALNIEELRDHAEEILRTIAEDLESPQNRFQQAEKSKGRSDPDSHDGSAAQRHGSLRAGKGFTLPQLVSEFRALRASVLRLWAEALGQSTTGDIEEITRFNEAIDQALAQSSERFFEDLERSKDLFLGILGHDLRGPLGAIMMLASRMLSQHGPNAPLAHAAARIMSSGLRMKQIIGDLLDFTSARLGTGIPIVRAQTNLEQVFQETVDEVAALHPEARLQFEVTGDLDGGWDGARLSQALSNLIGNAIQHGAANRPITIRAHGDDEGVVLSVHNWGATIPSGQWEQIFLPMKRLAPSPSSHTGSLGLGLYIAREIATAHGGTIEVQSSPGEGTAFTMHLPRSAHPSAGEREDQPEASHPGA